MTNSSVATLDSPSAPTTTKSDSSLKLIKTGTFAIGIKIAGAGAVFLSQVCIARALGHVGYGEYAFVSAVLQITLIFARGGFDTAAMRYLAQYKACQQFELARGYLNRSYQVTLICSFGIGLLMAGVATLVRNQISERMFYNFLIAGLGVPTCALLTLTSSAIRGFGSVIPSMLVEFSRALMFLIVLVLTGYVFKLSMSSSDALFLYVGAVACALGIALYLLRFHVRSLGEHLKPQYQMREWTRTSTQLMIGLGLVFLQGRTGVIISGMLLGSSAAGVYAVMERLVDAVLLGVTSLELLGAPRFAELHAQGLRDELQHYSRMLAWIATAFMAASVGFLLLYGKLILGLFGEEYVPHYPVLLILLIGTVVNAVSGSVYYLLNMTNNQSKIVRILTMSFAVNIVLSFILVPQFGLIGTACANIASVIAWNACMLYVTHVELGIWPNVGRLNSRHII